MKFRKMLKVCMALVMALVLMISSVVVSAESEIAESDEKPYTVTKISNPDRTGRMTDGLIEGGDRETSYAWCMADRGDYIYIGTNKSIGDMVISNAGAAFAAKGISLETVWDLVDVITNGELPRTTPEEGGYILRVSKETGKIENLYTAEKNVSFRMAIRFGDDIYFGSFAIDGESNNEILKLDKDDNIETVFTTSDGTSMRAACILDDKLYFGGVDASTQLDEGDEACAKLVILCKDEDDDCLWERVADYKDFGKTYTADPAMVSPITSPIWDICAYNGEIYATIPNNAGFAMFKGHPAKEGEIANAYGWCWEEVIGFNNGVNNIGLCDDAAGYQGYASGVLSFVATPFVYNDTLYLMDFDNTLMAELNAITGVIAQVLTRNGKPSRYLRTMYETLNHPQSIWKMDNETGRFEKVEGFSKASANPCTEYLWRTAEYDGELYVSTMDSATIYNYLTRLTNGSFLKMTPDEYQSQMAYIKKLIEDISAMTKQKEVEKQASDIAETAGDMVDDLEDMDLSPDTAEEYTEKYAQFYQQLMQAIASLKEKIIEKCTESMLKITQLLAKIEVLKQKIVGIYNSIDWEGLEMYRYISDCVSTDEWGFELYKSADGESFEPVTIDGFGDKYNYGGRTLLATDAGLYIGTANPFYGAQLYLLKNNNEKPEPDSYILGDVDGDGDVTAIDATCIQRWLANMPVDSFNEAAADIDGDGQVTVFDTTLIQKWLAGLPSSDRIGQPIGPVVPPVTDPTEPSDPTEPTSPTQAPGTNPSGLNTVGEVLTAYSDIPYYIDTEKFVCIAESDDHVYYITANSSEEIFDAITALSYEDPQYKQKEYDILKNIPISGCEDIKSQIISQEALDQYIGKKGQALFDDGFVPSGESVGDDGILVMSFVKGFFEYEVTFSEKVNGDDENFDAEKACKTMTISGARYDRATLNNV